MVMKRIYLLFALLAATTAAVMVGCTKEDEIEPIEIADPLGYTMLVDGRSFGEMLPGDATEVRFVYGDKSTKSGKLLSLPGSEKNVYGNMQGTTWVVSTEASMVYANEDCAAMFMNDDGSQLRKVDFGQGFNTTKVTNMSQMFSGCSELAELDLTMFNTANVVNMSLMFNGCSALDSLNLSSFSTAKVSDMRRMFCNCTQMRELDLYYFDIHAISDAEHLQKMCENLAGESGECHILCSLEMCSVMMRYCGMPGWVRFTWVTH